MPKLPLVMLAIITLAACKAKEEKPAEPADIAYERARIKLEQKYKDIDEFALPEGFARASADSGYTYVDSTGRELVPHAYNVQRFREGLGLVELGENGPYYYIDTSGKKVLDLPGYTNAFGFYRGYAVVANKDGHYGLIDKTGKEVIPCIYDEGPQQVKGDNYSVTPLQGGKIIINIKGGAALPFKDFKEVYYDSTSNKFAVSNDSGWFLMDDKGAVLKKFDADGVLYAGDGVYIVSKTTEGKGTENGVMDGKGAMLVPYGKYYSIEQWSEGLACVGIETGTSPNKDEAGVMDVHQKIGYIDKTGKEVIPLTFEDAMMPFTEGLAAAIQKGKYGYIDKTGAWVIQPRFEKAKSFSHGYAQVSDGGDWYYIDRMGKRVE